MSYGKLSGLVIWLTLVMFSVVGCVGVPTAAPVVEAPVATPTPVPPTVAPPPAKPTPELRAEKMTSPALAGNLLGDPVERTMYVLLPPSYETSEKRYPVVYVMPGGNGLPTHFTMGFTYASQDLLGKDEINEMILVFPDGTSRLGGGLFVSSPAIGDYETYFIRDVVDYVDTHYRTLPTRDSRGLAGCSRGGGTSMRFGLKYPNLFSVVAATGGEWDNSPEVWPTDVERVRRLQELPTDISDLDDVTNWWVQMAAGAAPDLDNPPFYGEMPFRIVDGHGEFVPEVVAKITELDSTQEARRYLQQPVRLRGIWIQHGTYDHTNAPSIHSFKQLLDDLGIEHEYVEVDAGHCGGGWEAASLKYLSDHLVFEE
jgi:enterochelin esterase-like enzyme